MVVPPVRRSVLIPARAFGPMWGAPMLRTTLSMSCAISSKMTTSMESFLTGFDTSTMITATTRRPCQNLGSAGTPTPTNAAFLTARRNAVTTFLRDAYEAATDLKPWTVVGTVPIIYFTSFSDTYNDVLQFWPGWTAAKTRNRAFSFGAEDRIQPQAYRSGATYGPDNTVYLDLGRYGDLASYSLDYGLMPGANVNFCPLFYHPTTGDAAQSLLNAQNVCDSNQKECNGSGIYSADTVRTDIRIAIRN